MLLTLLPGKSSLNANVAIIEQLTWDALESKGWPVPRKAAQLGEKLMKFLPLGLM